MVWVYNCSPDITSCRFEHTRTSGLYYHTDATKAFVISGNTFDDCSNAIALLNTNAPSEFKSNTIKNCTG